MTKHEKKTDTFVPPDAAYDRIPEAKRNDVEFKADINAWFTKWQTTNRKFHGPAFVGWCNEMIGGTEDVLLKLYFRFGIRPSTVFERLVLRKHFLLTQKQLEAGDWIIDVPSWYIGQAQLQRNDSRMARMLRDKRLNERNARILEKAAYVLIEYPRYLGVVRDMRDPWDLPDRLNSIAADIREAKVGLRHRPQAAAARSVVTDLVFVFQKITGKPLYEYAGLLTQACFPEEWNPAGDIREAAKKLVKSRERKSSRS